MVRISSDAQVAGGVELYITEKPTKPSIILSLSVNNSAVKKISEDRTHGAVLNTTNNIWKELQGVGDCSCFYQMLRGAASAA